MPNPLQDLAAFLTAGTGDFDALGPARYVLILSFYALAAASVLLLAANLRRDRAQRRGALLWLWATRVLIGTLWFRAVLWTLPFGPDNDLHRWTEQVAGRAAVPQLARFVDGTVLPHFAVFDPLCFLVAFGFAAAFLLGLFVRPAGLASLVVALVLWLGLYGQRAGDPAEWPWSFVLLALLGGQCAVFAAGRALGADAWIRRNVPSVRDRRPAGWQLRLLT